MKHYTKCAVCEIDYNTEHTYFRTFTSIDGRVHVVCELCQNKKIKLDAEENEKAAAIGYEPENINIASGNYSMAMGRRNIVNGDHSIVISGDSVTVDENYKLIIKYDDPNGYLPSIDIDETISEREHHLIYNALRAYGLIHDRIYK